MFYNAILMRFWYYSAPVPKNLRNDGLYTILQLFKAFILIVKFWLHANNSTEALMQINASTWLHANNSHANDSKEIGRLCNIHF